MKKLPRVAKGFFCIKTKKVYNVGDIYKGKRTDLSHLMEVFEDKKAPETKKGAIEKK